MLQLLGDRRGGVPDAAKICALLMDNGRIMNERLDSVRFEMPYKACAMRRPDDKKMPHMGFRVGRQSRHRHQRVRYLATVATRDLPAQRVVVIQISEPYAQACGLQLIDAAVGAAKVVDVLARRAVIAEQTNTFGKRRIIGAYASRIPHCTKVLRRVEAEASGVTERPDTSRPHARAMRLGCVFEQE